MSPRLRWVTTWIVLAGALLLQSVLAQSWPRHGVAQHDPGLPPDPAWVRAWSLGETAAAAYGMLLYLQTFDTQAAAHVRVRELHADHIRAWLEHAATLHPDSGYPFLLATRIYASALARPDSQALLDWVAKRFVAAPAQRWPWLAHAVWVARYELHDLPRATRYARALREHTAEQEAPAWARQMELFVLAANNQLSAARTLLEGLVQSGQIQDPAELKVLLRALERSLPEPKVEHAD